MLSILGGYRFSAVFLCPLIFLLYCFIVFFFFCYFCLNLKHSYFQFLFLSWFFSCRRKPCRWLPFSKYDQICPSNHHLFPRSTQFRHIKYPLGAENYTKHTQLNPKVHKVVPTFAQSTFQKFKITPVPFNRFTKVFNVPSTHSDFLTGPCLYSDNPII